MKLERTMRIETGDSVNVSRLEMDVHTGTHIDAPWHFLASGRKVEDIALDELVGPAYVAHFAQETSITEGDLERARIPEDVSRLLLRTRNSLLWARKEQRFHDDFVALTHDAARWIVERRIRLVGNDYLSVQRYHDGPETHHVLLGAGVVVLEGLDLSEVEPGAWELVCLPLRLLDAEAAPARAFLRREVRP